MEGFIWKRNSVAFKKNLQWRLHNCGNTTEGNYTTPTIYQKKNVKQVAEYHRMFAQQGQPSSASLQHSRLPQPLQGQTTPPQGNLMRDNMASPAPVSPLLGAQPRVEVSEGGVEALMRILHAFTAILCSASQYNCDDVEQRCKKLPTALRKTHYIQGVLGSAYYDDGQHSKAADCFALMRRLCQYKIDDSLSLYSSCLWQLQREKDLATSRRSSSKWTNSPLSLRLCWAMPTLLQGTMSTRCSSLRAGARWISTVRMRTHCVGWSTLFWRSWMMPRRYGHIDGRGKKKIFSKKKINRHSV